MTALARAHLAVALLPVGLLLSVACSRDNTPDTGIIVEVSSDLRVPQDIDQVQLTATDPQGNQLYLNTFDLGEGPNRFKLPFRTGLYPLQDTATPIHVVAVGQLSTVGKPVASRSATLSFVHGKKVVLPLPLLAVCKGVACEDASFTCQANGQCDSDTVDSKNLPAYVANQPVPATDAATLIPDAQMPVLPMDAAVDKSVDSAVDRALDLVPEVAGDRDAFFATGGAGGTDAPSDAGGAMGTDAGPIAFDARSEVWDTPGVDAPPDVPVGGSGGTGGTTATGGITASGGKTSAGGSVASGGMIAAGGSADGGATGVGVTGGSGEAGVPDVPGAEPDVPMGGAVCGDGVVVPPEQCDDRNTVAGDGCSPTCRIETGFACSGSPSICVPTICGDGKIEGTEACDDGNTMPFDGCSENCQREPNCSGTSCISTCGDGIIVPSEQCDDGNVTDGDGCSKTCQIEPGWTCAQAPLGDQMMVPVIYRDFRFHNPSEFEAGVVGQTVATTGEVNSDLDQDGKPVFSGLAAAHIASIGDFAEWYRTTSGVNHATASKLVLWKNADGNYVNRYGPSGEQWNVTEPAIWCGTVGQELLDANGMPIPCTFQYQQSVTNPTGGQTDCQKEEAKGYTLVPGSCKNNGSGTYTAQYIVAKADGNPLFFPIDNDPFSASELTGAQVPSVPAGLYDASGSWPWDLDASGNKRLHNFSFTSEVRYWFLYDETKSYTIDFVGDDDVWVFINKKLAVDLGGIHTPVEGSITLNAAAAAKLGGMQSGNVYEIAVFQTERQTTCSSYKLTLMGFDSAPSTCTPN